MFKKLLIALLFTVNLHAMDQPGNFSYVPKPDHSFRNLIGSLVLIRALEEAPKIDKYIEKYAESLTEEELEKFIIRLNRVVFVAQVAVGIYAAVSFYPIFNDIYDHFYPSEAQKAATKAAIEANKLFDAKWGFRECLMKNDRTPRNASSIPTACEELANAYGAVAGQPALDEMVTNFKGTYAYKEFGQA